jgi:hypothetical protein
MKEFFTWDSLKSITNIALATGLITQITKMYVPIPTQIWAYIVATLILIFQDLRSKNYSGIPLSLVNGFVVASVASKTYDLLNK